MKIRLRSIKSKIPKRLRSKKLLLFVLALFVLWFVVNRGAGDTRQIKTVQAQQKSIESEVTASGKVKSVSQVVMHFPTAGRVVGLNITEGQYVWPGTAIATLDGEQLQIAVRQAEQNVVAADAVLSQVYDDMKKYTQAENFDQKIRRTNAERAKNQAYDALLSAKKNLRESTIYAPFGGTVVSMPITTGQEIQPMTDIAEIADLGNIEFVADVDETEINKLKEGQNAKILLDAFGGKQFDSTVFRLGTKSKVSTTGATAFEATFYLPAGEAFRLGMSGEARVITQRTGETAVIPQEAIVNSKYVWVKEGSTYHKKEIEKGLESDTEVEVTKNVKAGDQIVIGGTNEINKKSLLQKITGIFAK